MSLGPGFLYGPNKNQLGTYPNYPIVKQRQVELNYLAVGQKSINRLVKNNRINTKIPKSGSDYQLRVNSNNVSRENKTISNRLPHTVPAFAKTKLNYVKKQKCQRKNNSRLVSSTLEVYDNKNSAGTTISTNKLVSKNTLKEVLNENDEAILVDGNNISLHLHQNKRPPEANGRYKDPPMGYWITGTLNKDDPPPDYPVPKPTDPLPDATCANTLRPCYLRPYPLCSKGLLFQKRINGLLPDVVQVDGGLINNRNYMQTLRIVKTGVPNFLSSSGFLS